MYHASGPRAFTIIELLVVVSIIVVLLSLLAPALDKAVNEAELTVCKSNLRVIQMSTVQYALSNRSNLFTCNGREIQTAFSPGGADGYSSRANDASVDWLAAMATVGLAESGTQALQSGRGAENSGVGAIPNVEQLHQPGPMWVCPSTQFDLSLSWDSYWSQWWVGYQYLGGVHTWYNSFDYPGGIPSKSPSKLNKSSGGWLLASDRSFLANDEWTDLDAPAFRGNPNHKSEKHNGPAGNNQVYMDGSVDWVEGKDLLYLHGYRGGFTEKFFFLQKDLGSALLTDVSRAETYFVAN